MGVERRGIQFSKWHNVLLRRIVRLLSVSGSGMACTTVPQWSARSYSLSVTPSLHFYYFDLAST